MLRRFVASLLVASLACSAAARAEAPPRSIAIGEALDLAATGATQPRVATAQVDVARTEIAVAGIFPNPRVALGTTTATALLTGSVVFFLPVFGQVGVARDAGRAQVATREANLGAAKLDARLAAALAWIDLWLAEHESAIARDEATRSERVATVARAREDEGSSPHLDVLRAEADAARALAEADALAIGVRAQEARLALALGADAQTEHYVTRGAPLGEVDVPPASSDMSAIAQHPLVRTADAAVREADASAARAGRARFPILALQVGGTFFKRQAPENDVQFGIALDIPIFDGPLVTRADSQRVLAAVAADGARVDASGRLAAARAEALAAIGRARATAEKVLPAAEQAAALSIEAYEHGALDLTAVLAAEQTLAQTRLSAVRTEAERGRAIARLRWAAGLP